MRNLLALGAAAGLIAAGATLAAARTGNRHQTGAAPTYDIQCFGLKTLGRDINAQARSGWTVKAMADHTSPEGQECVLVLFERATP
ncbi:MAG TPA: hypothetical protein VFB89_06615 [Gemmatimonadales bacterium]|jgi:hypothetical protein|nr:hypothetical protein [Gemmatimonadales bacterium]